MSWFSALITLATGVVLPTLDVYSDIALAVKLLMFKPRGKFSGGESKSDLCNKDQPGWRVTNKKCAAAMLTPPLISWLFVTYQWFKNEAGIRQKLMTLPFLILQVYPQWRAMRVLYYGKWKKQRGWHTMKEEWETEICNLGRSPYHTFY